MRKGTRSAGASERKYISRPRARVISPFRIRAHIDIHVETIKAARARAPNYISRGSVKNVALCSARACANLTHKLRGILFGDDKKMPMAEKKGEKIGPPAFTPGRASYYTWERGARASTKRLSFGAE